MPDVTQELSCQDIWLRYAPGLPLVLRGVTLTVAPREVVAVVGHNGAGKSTLIKALIGAARPERGAITLDGRRTEGLSVRDVMAAGLSCVWQELSIIPTMSVRNNLMLGMSGRAALVRSPRKASRAVAELTARCELNDLDMDRPAGELAFIDRQRVEIGKALATRSRYLLLDEPTAGQRGAERAGLFDLIRNSARQGVGILLVDHHLDEVMELADRAVVLRDGEVVGQLGPSELSIERMTALMTGHDVAGSATAPPRVHLSSHSLDSADPGSADGPTPRAASSTRLRCRLSRESLPLVDLELSGGVVYGFYGQEGAGQAALMEMLSGSARPDAGWIEIDGHRRRFKSPADAVRNGVAYLSGDRTEMVVPSMTGTDNLFIAKMAASPLLGLAPTRRQREKIVADLTQGLEVRGDWRGAVTDLSGGNQQKLILARVLQGDLSVVLMQGPTLGVDVTARAQILSMIRTLARDRGVTVCLASEDEDEVMDACDQVFVVAGGRIVDQIETGPALTKQRLRAAAVAVSAAPNDR